MTKRIVLSLLLIAVLSSNLLVEAQTYPPFLPSSEDSRCKQWLDSVFSRMNLDEKVGQLLLATVPAKAD